MWQRDRVGTEGEGCEAMTTRRHARSLVQRLLQVPNATPAKLLAEYRRLVAADLTAKGKASVED